MTLHAQSGPLNLTLMLDELEKTYVFDNEAPLQVDLRRTPGTLDFYVQVEKQLQNQNLFTVSDYRIVKEGRTKISRPSQITITKAKLIDNRPHIQIIQEKIAQLSEKYSTFSLNHFLKSSYQELKFQLDLIDSCASVLDHLEKNKLSIQGLYSRQIPHGFSTKLIGKENILLRIFSNWKQRTCSWSDFYFYYKILNKPIEFRFYAPKCQWKDARLDQFHGVISQSNYDKFSFNELKQVLLIENFDAFLGLVPVSNTTLLIWTGGWRVIGLKKILSCLPNRILYWGDIDKDGYEIMGMTLNYAPSAIPIFMDQETILRFTHLIQRKPAYQGPYKEIGKLQQTYEKVSRQGIFIEQEQLLKEFIEDFPL
jgi:hypothetical protein